MIKTLKDLNRAGKTFWSRPNRDDAGKSQPKSQDSLAGARWEDLNKEEQGYLRRKGITPEQWNKLTPKERYALMDTQDAYLDPALKHNAPPGMELCPNCGGYGRKYGVICDVCHGKGIIPEGSADAAKDFSTNPAEIEAAAKKAKAAGKSKEEFVAGYSGGAAEVAAKAWAKDGTKDSLSQEIADMLAVQGKMTLEQIQQELERSGWDVTRSQVLVGLSIAKAKNSGGVWKPE